MITKQRVSASLQMNEKPKKSPRPVTTSVIPRAPKSTKQDRDFVAACGSKGSGDSSLAAT